MEAWVKRELQRECGDYFEKLSDEVIAAICEDVHESFITFIR